MPAPMLLLAAVAERTKTLRLGIAIVLPLSHPLHARAGSAELQLYSVGILEVDRLSRVVIDYFCDLDTLGDELVPLLLKRHHCLLQKQNDKTRGVDPVRG